MTVVLGSSSVVAGTSTTATASGRDQQGQPIATGTVSWVSSNAAVASVDAGGQVLGVAQGDAIITATASGVSAAVSIRVTPAPSLSRLAITLSTASVRSGERITAAVTGFDQFNAPITVPAVTWASSAPAVALAEQDGRVLGVLVGSATISARAGTVSATTTVAVLPGAAFKLGIARPASGIFSNWRFTVQPQLEVTDAAGNRITTDNTTVVQLSSTPGTIGTTAATAVSGVASFANAGVTAIVGATASLTFTAQGLTSTTQSVTVAPFSFGNGVRLVGTDVRPGRYRSVNASTASCYWARLRNTTGTNDIIANDIGPGPRLLEVLASDVAVESSRCGTWVEVTGPATTSRTAPFTDGMYLVGIDIDPGTWRADTVNASCYWARLRNVNGIDDIIANYIGSTPAIMTILPGDVAVDVSRCGTWVRVP